MLADEEVYQEVEEECFYTEMGRVAVKKSYKLNNNLDLLLFN